MLKHCNVQSSAKRQTFRFTFWTMVLECEWHGMSQNPHTDYQPKEESKP